jgi:CheY-like chemotaxis protein
MTAPKRILVVDDSPTIRRVVEQALVAAGHAVTTVADGEHALAEAPGVDPDLILLDFMMPAMNGYQVAKALDERGEVDCPVVLMCTRNDELPEALLRPLGVVDYITKPFSPEAVVALVEYALAKHGVKDRQETTPFAGVSLEAMPDLEATEELEATRPDTPRPLLDAIDGEDLDDDLAAAAALSDLVSVLSDALFARGIPEADELSRSICTQVRQGLSSALLKELVRRELGVGALRKPMPSLYGDLSAVPLPEVLQLLKFQGQTGVLEVSLSEARFEAAFRDGRIVAIRARNVRGELRLGHYFVSSGSVTREKLEQLLSEPSDGRAIGQRLVDEGLLTQESLKAALGAQAEDLMYEMLRADRGVFGLRRDADFGGVLDGTPGFSVDSLLVEGLRRVDEWHVIEKEVPSFDARFQRAPDAVDDALGEDEKKVFELLPALGTRAVRDLIADAELRPYDVCKLLYRLIMLGRARRVEGEPEETAPSGESTLSGEEASA